MNQLIVKNVEFNYSQSNNKAVNDVSFEIESGSYTAIVGLNGSGKSTLARLLCGLIEPSSGSISWEGNPRIGIVFQSPKEQLVSGIVYRDTEFGPLNLHLPNDEVELRTIESLNVVDMLDRASSSTSALSLGQTQKIALAGIIALQPDVLILDESVAMLDPLSRQDIFELLRYFHKTGKTILHISHETKAILEADRIIGMENGSIYFHGTKEEFLNNKDFKEKIEGTKLASVNKRNLVQFGKKETSLKLDNVSFNYDKNSGINKVSFELYKGTLTALTGPSGAGKSTILELCSGLLSPSGGTISCTENTRPVLTQQNSQAALFETFAEDDVAFGPRNKGVKGQELINIVKESMDAAYLPFEKYSGRHTFELSGGEQRRLAIAGILAMQSDVVLFDEPTAGLDSKARYEVMCMLRKLADEGKTVMFSTHQNDEADFADREIRIEKGRLVKDTCESVNESEQAVYEKSFSSVAYNVNMLNSLRKITITVSGANNYKKSLIQKVPAFLRVLLFLLLFVVCICAKSIMFSTIMFLISSLYCAVCGVRLRKFFVSCFKILPFLLIFSIFQLIFHPALADEPVYLQWKFLLVTPSKLLFCLTALIRTFAALGSITGFFISTPEYDLIDGLKILLKPLELIKIPVRYFILIMEIIFRFIPLLIDEAICIIKTQLIRGGLGKAKGKMGRIKAYIPLVVPMILQTIKRSEALADAITVRCFK